MGIPIDFGAICFGIRKPPSALMNTQRLIQDSRRRMTLPHRGRTFPFKALQAGISAKSAIALWFVVATFFNFHLLPFFC